MKSKFIVLEGTEGAGKSTQIRVIKEVLGDSVIITREPGGSPYAEEIRRLILNSPDAQQADAKTHFALFWAARADHMKNNILPGLAAGRHVISDRFDSSTFAYQIYGQKAKQLEKFFWQTREFYLEGNFPDIYIFMDVDIETGLQRKAGQGADEINHFDQRKIDFHRRMRQGYMDFLPHVPHVIINANQDQEKVTVDLLKVIRELVEQ